MTSEHVANEILLNHLMNRQTINEKIIRNDNNF